MTASLLAYARISASGLLTQIDGQLRRTAWQELDGARPGLLGGPDLKARWFFDEPYPKFGRMDPLSKLGVAVSRLLAPAISGMVGDDVGLVGGTQLGCLEADAAFEQSRLSGAPSPALFVYTLPSTFLGEVAILHRLRGRCALLSAGRLSGLTALATAVRWIEKGRSRHVLAIAADAAGPAAQALDAANTPQSAAAAWLLSADGNGPRLGGVQYTEAADGRPPGELRYGMTWVDTLEPLLLARESGRFTAAIEGQCVSFEIG